MTLDCLIDMNLHKLFINNRQKKKESEESNQIYTKEGNNK